MPVEAVNPFGDQMGPYGAADDAFEIVPSDGDELPFVVRQIRAGQAGTIRFKTYNGTELTFDVSAGEATPLLRIRQVFAAGTSATGLVGIV